MEGREEVEDLGRHRASSSLGSEQDADRGQEDWHYVDWLEWMGDILTANSGSLTCPNPQCMMELGMWSWDHEVGRGQASTGPPVIALDKALVKNTSYVFSRVDSMRVDSRASEKDVADLRRGSGVLESKLEGFQQ
ncbi:unnamed protein product [Discosporangium mesarthrocarpum]